MTQAIRDENHVTVALGVSSTDDTVTLPLKIDPATGRLLVAAAAGGYTNLTQFVDQTAWRIFYSNTDGDVVEFAFGAVGTVLTSGGASAVPTWSSAGAGDVTAAANLGDNLLIRGNGAGKGVQNSGITIDDSDNVTGMANLTATGALLSGLTASEIVITDGSKNLVSAAVATYPSLAELAYVKGVTSAIQTQIDALSGAVVLKGLWDASVGTFPGGGVAQSGWSYIVSVGGTVDGEVFVANDRIVAITDNASTTVYAANWHKLDYTDAVLSVFGRTGAVTATDGDYSQSLITGLKTSDSPQFAAVNIGAATDTTLARVSAGVVSIEGDNIMTVASADTVTGTKTLSTTADIKLGSAATDKCAIQLNNAALNDESWSGIIIAATAGATLAVGDLCYLNTAASEWLLTDGILDGTDSSFALKLGICVLASTDGNVTEILLDGVIASAAFPAFTVGAPVYMSDTAGDMVVAQPSTTNFAIRVLGFAVSATVLHFRPSNDYIVHV